jgi:hypothetical protein
VIALWVRSYWWVDSVGLPTSGTAVVSSLEGTIGGVNWPRDVFPAAPGGWWRSSTRLQDIRLRPKNRSSWQFIWNRANAAVIVPHWFLAMVFATLAPAPWLRWRFGFRALLIGITLVAVVLGIAVYTARK